MVPLEQALVEAAAVVVLADGPVGAHDVGGVLAREQEDLADVVDERRQQEIGIGHSVAVHGVEHLEHVDFLAREEEASVTGVDALSLLRHHVPDPHPTEHRVGVLGPEPLDIVVRLRLMTALDRACVVTELRFERGLRWAGADLPHLVATLTQRALQHEFGAANELHRARVPVSSQAPATSLKSAPVGSAAVASRPYGVSSAGIDDRAAELDDLGERGVGVVDPEVDRPVRGHALGQERRRVHDPGERAVAFAERRVAELGRVAHRRAASQPNTSR